MRNIPRKFLSVVCLTLTVAIMAPGVVLRAAGNEDTLERTTITAASAKSDSEIQQCIAEKLAASPALKDQGLNAAVNNGAATLTGTARNPGSKGNATRIAKKCGATLVTNNISISPAFKQKKAGTDKLR